MMHLERPILNEGLSALSHFNPDLDGDRPLQSVLWLRSEVGLADGLLVSSPEQVRVRRLSSGLGFHQSKAEAALGRKEIWRRPSGCSTSPGTVLKTVWHFNGEKFFNVRDAE
jgi:hypothetical protein